MKTFKKVVGYVSIALGVFFLANTGTDIQLGFGLVLITNGIFNI